MGVEDGGQGSRRLAPLDQGSLDAAQQSVLDEIRSGRRGMQLSGPVELGPFDMLLRSPGLARHLQRVGEHLRFDSGLPASVLELAILATAQHWRAEYEWYAHAPLARDAGIHPDDLDSLRLGGRGTHLDGRHQSVLDFSRQLLQHGNVDDDTFRSMLTMLGERSLVDLIGVLGYYSCLAFMLNAANQGLPPGAVPAFVDIGP